ncbi:MAG: VWA domain-containing protein [Planctomycetota bacterium]
MIRLLFNPGNRGKALLLFVALWIGGLPGTAMATPVDEVDTAVQRERRPLDLPAPGRGTDDDDPEPLDQILFYNQEFEGDGFFFCLDRSGSMNLNGRLETMKLEFRSTVSQLSSHAEFGVITFSTNVTFWSSAPQRAFPATRAAAANWVEGLEAIGWTCLSPAGVKTLELAGLSAKRNKQIFILGDGEPICDGTDTTALCLQSITAANHEDLSIHCLLIGASSGSAAATFFQTLAAMNRGTFTLVP